MHTPLFLGKLIKLSPLDPESDAEIEARWSQDPDFNQLISADTVRPLFTAQVKKQYEALTKDEANHFRFGIRTAADDRLVGFIDLRHIEWNNGGAWLSMGIGKPEDRGHGYGREALRMMLQYAFDELNLFSISAYVCEYNRRTIDLFEAHGFRQDVRMRALLHRFGRRWDMFIYGLLIDDWKAAHDGWEVSA